MEPGDGAGAVDIFVCTARASFDGLPPPEVENQRGRSILHGGPMPLQGLGHGWLLKMQIEDGEWDRLC